MKQTSVMFKYPFEWEKPTSLGVKNITFITGKMIYPQSILEEGKDFTVDRKNGTITFPRWGRILNAVRIYRVNMISVRFDIDYKPGIIERIKGLF